MQFKHPEILWAFFLLLIPIIIHLFQLRRFKQVAFTNVAFLKKVKLQTRKSSQLKKWLLLFTRLLLLSCLILAFAQPYTAKLDSFKNQKETVIYIDNSFSMQARGSNGSLLNAEINDLISYFNEDENISLFTNDKSFINTNIKSIKNDLIALTYSSNQLPYDAVFLKAKQLFSKENSIKNLIVVSDFQQKYDTELNLPNDNDIEYNLVKLEPENINNISIDSAYVSKSTPDIVEVKVLLSNQGEALENVPVSLWEEDKLFTKNGVALDEKGEVIFSLPANKNFNGRISIDDIGLKFDNDLYFNLSEKSKINVLGINGTSDTFLKKMYTDDEFDYVGSELKDLDYSLIPKQNIIVLNEIKSIPNGLQTALLSYYSNGGSLLITPNIEANITTYNPLLNALQLPQLKTLINTEKRITDINFNHPIFENTFNKKITNFQYPKVNSFFDLSYDNGSALSFEDGSTFVSNSKKAYLFSASIDTKNSNFKSSPLIVPLLYNIGLQSLEIPKLYYHLGENNNIAFKESLGEDEVLTLENSSNNFIPLQQAFANQVVLKVEALNLNSGHTKVKKAKEDIGILSFNHNRNESVLNYFSIEDHDNVNSFSSMASAINTIKSDTQINALWKWFIIFAVVFLIIEMLILKYFK